MKLKQTILTIIAVLAIVLVPVATSAGAAYAAGNNNNNNGGGNNNNNGNGNGNNNNNGGNGGGNNGGNGGGAASSCGTGSTAQGQVLQGIGQTGGNCSDKQVNNAFQAIVQILSIIVGVASVIMIMFGGFKYVVSGGESGRVSSAKTTVLYAMVGLGIASAAELLIHFVLFRATNV